MQKLIAGIWDNVSLEDPELRKSQLPTRFAKMVLHDNERMSIAEIIERYSIPEPLAKFYYEQAPFFLMLRRYRDDIIHRGINSKLAFVTKRGFAIHGDVKPFVDFEFWKNGVKIPVWNEDHQLPNNLSSLRPVIAHVVLQTLSACEEFTNAITESITFPSETFPEFKLFIRGYHLQELLKLSRIQDECLWWDEE